MNKLSLVGAAALLATAGTAGAQTITTIPDAGNCVYNTSFVSPGDIPGGAAANIAITSAQPRNGNGSLELQMTKFAQPAVTFCGSAVQGSLASLSALSFDYLGENVVNTSPTIRLTVPNILLNDVNRTLNFGWYKNDDAASWVNSGNLVDATGSNGFWLRLTGSGGGQLGLDCSVSSIAGSFDDRRQSLASWLSACDGSAGKLNLAEALIAAVGIDQGRWPGFDGTNVNYVDNVNVRYGEAGATYNFETATVPEPSTYALMAAGLAALGLVARRRRA